MTTACRTSRSHVFFVGAVFLAIDKSSREFTLFKTSGFIIAIFPDIFGHLSPFLLESHEAMGSIMRHREDSEATDELQKLKPSDEVSLESQPLHGLSACSLLSKFTV